MRIALKVVSDHAPGKVLYLKQVAFFIGRDDNCDLRIKCDRVSRYHCAIITDPEVVVRDLGSTNGTLVNGKGSPKPQPLKTGDILTVGSAVFEVEIIPDEQIEELEVVDWLSAAKEGTQPSSTASTRNLTDDAEYAKFRQELNEWERH